MIEPVDMRVAMEFPVFAAAHDALASVVDSAALGEVKHDVVQVVHIVMDLTLHLTVHNALREELTR